MGADDRVGSDHTGAKLKVKLRKSMCQSSPDPLATEAASAKSIPESRDQPLGLLQPRNTPLK